jgi:uncharacterized small protein (DUF1192 family)
MFNYLSRKKTLMGRNYEVEVALEQYGGDVVRVHAIPDMELAKIEDRSGYKLEDALATLSSHGLSEAEIAALNAEPLPPEVARKASAIISDADLTAIQSGEISAELDAKLAKSFLPDEIAALKVKRATKELTMKASQALSPKLTLFLGELCKAGIVPNPGCTCKGEGCDECDVAAMVDELRSYSVLAIGMAVIGASTASWKDIESFFLAQKAQSGAVLPA